MGGVKKVAINVTKEQLKEILINHYYLSPYKESVEIGQLTIGEFSLFGGVKITYKEDE